jgi:hypothetical protein
VPRLDGLAEFQMHSGDIHLTEARETELKERVEPRRIEQRLPGVPRSRIAPARIAGQEPVEVGDDIHQVSGREGRQQEPVV